MISEVTAIKEGPPQLPICIIEISGKTKISKKHEKIPKKMEKKFCHPKVEGKKKNFFRKKCPISKADDV